MHRCKTIAGLRVARAGEVPPPKKKPGRSRAFRVAGASGSVAGADADMPRVDVVVAEVVGLPAGSDAPGVVDLEQAVDLAAEAAVDVLQVGPVRLDLALEALAEVAAQAGGQAVAAEAVVGR